MVTKPKSVNEILYCLYFILFLISYIIPSFFSSFSQYFLVIESSIILFLLIINAKTMSKDSKNVILILLILIISLISIIFSDGGFGSFLNLFHFFGGIIVFYNIKINSKMQNFVYLICGILWLYNVKLSFNAWNLYVSRNHIYNPNSVGISIFLTSIILKSLLTKYDKKIITILLFIISGYCIFLTNCRTALIALIMYMLVSYIPILNKLIIKYNKFIIYLVIIIGTIFPVIYLNMYVNNINFEIPFIGKKLYTGREILWGNMLEALDSERYAYMLGLGTNYYTEMGIINNFHNWYIGVLYTFGLPVLCIYFYVLANIISKVNDKEMLYGLIAILVIGFAETVGLWTTTQTYIFIILIVQRILIDRGEKNRVKK